MTRLSQAQLKKIGVAPATKYHSRKTEIDGHVFDSKKEADKYCELVLLKKAGEIILFTLQPKFLLQEGFTDRSGHKHRPIFYIADFMVFVYGERTQIIDVKGMKTDVYQVKKKLFIKQYPIYEFIEC
jgi:hypothetical protein